MKRCLAVVFLICASFLSNATIVQGFVYGENNLPLPFCNIYETTSLSGCASNDEGFFQLHLEPGKHIIAFQYIGYKKKEVEVEISSELFELNVTLEPDVIELDEVVIRPGEEDPAYEIIRSAIEKRKEHLTENNRFSCEVYMKGLQKLKEAPDKILGIELNTILDLDSNNAGIIYFSESVSDFYFEYPNKTKEVMVASKVSGNSNQFSWNDARSMQMNFYENFISFEGFSQRGFVSPIADNALFFYDYRLMGSYMEGGRYIYKIEVTPKRKSDPVFFGTIYIRDIDFRIYSLDLSTSKSQGLEFIDTFNVAQEFIQTADERWVMVSNKFNFSYSFFGIEGLGYFNAFYKNYNLAPDFGDDFFTDEISVITENSNKQDSVFWGETRPVPLTDEEVHDYAEKDELEKIKESPAYKDSVDRIFNRFAPGDLISGYHYRNSNKNILVNTSSAMEFLQFNTVEGWVINPAMRIQKITESKDEFDFTPSVRYSFAKNRITGSLVASLNYDNFHSASISIEGGNIPAPFNPKGISPFVNSLYTLFLEENYLKLYDRQYFGISQEREIANGFVFYTGIEFSNRSQLFNATGPEPLFDIDDRGYTSNNFPFYADDSILASSRRFLIDLRFRFTPHQLYMTTPDEKYILESKYPFFIFQYKKAVPSIFNSDIDFDFIGLSIHDEVRLHIFGNLEYQITGGLFLQAEKTRFEDYFQFAGNETWFSSPGGTGFMLLPYYYASGQDKFYEQHIQWHTEGFVFNKLPLFKQLKLQPVFTLNYLTTPTVTNYVEFAAGIEHLFKFVRIDFAYTPFKFEDYQTAHFKILAGIGF